MPPRSYKFLGFFSKEKRLSNPLFQDGVAVQIHNLSKDVGWWSGFLVQREHTYIKLLSRLYSTRKMKYLVIIWVRYGYWLSICFDEDPLWVPAAG